MKLMEIDMDELGIPETDYDSRVTMSSSEFAPSRFAPCTDTHAASPAA